MHIKLEMQRYMCIESLAFLCESGPRLNIEIIQARITSNHVC